MIMIKEEAMSYSNRWALIFLLLAALLLSSCATRGAEADKIEPAVVEPIAGTDLNRVTLSERAAERLDVQTAKISDQQIAGETRLVAPYSAVIYGLNGETWVFTSPEPLVFVRAPIAIDYIEGDQVFLLDGPPAGTEVATVAVPELYGIDTGVGK